MMNHPQQPSEYDAVLGGQSSALEDAAVLGGIEGVKFRLSNPELKMKIIALKQALNYEKQGLDLVIQALKDESWDVQNAAYCILIERTEPRVKQVLQDPHRLGFKLESIEVVTVNNVGKIIQRQQRIARYFTEELSNGETLEMAAIPGGIFIMGAPETEKGSSNDERPQTQVTIQPSIISKYPITQVQWRVVAALPKVKRDLNPDPSKFKGHDHPVECISWDDAVEFCARLSKKTGRDYHLPSEAKWEYACRAGTTTPFYFGETITTDLANYDGNYTYALVSKGKFRRETTPVGSFPPNAFGLYDMHGNVWEWCADTYHKNYISALRDGCTWEKNSDNYYRLLRGGSWCSYPRHCRSACRHLDGANLSNIVIGFRVGCRNPDLSNNKSGFSLFTND